MIDRAGSAPLTHALATAAALTVVVAVGADLLAGAHSAHIAGMGVVALTLGAVRVRAAGRHRVLFGILSAAVVLPPLLDASTSVTADEGSFHHLDADSATSMTHLGLAFGVALAVGAAEVILDLAASRVATWARGLVMAAPSPVETSVPPARPRPLAGTRQQGWGRFESRRGPPPRHA